MTTTEACYWLLIPVVFLGGIGIAAGIYEIFFLDTPYTQAEGRKKANARFGEIIGGDQ